MRITKELREWMKGSTLSSWTAEHLTAIADRIDAEHERLMQEQPFTVDMVPMTDERMAEHGWIRLPVDADGVTWHIGDRTESGQTIKAMGLNKHGWHFVGTVNEIDPAIHRHHHEPTVEDVLREFAQEMNYNMGMYTGEAIDADEWRDADAKTISEYAAKLRLAEGDDV